MHQPRKEASGKDHLSLRRSVAFTIAAAPSLLVAAHFEVWIIAPVFFSLDKGLHSHLSV
jgi:hypothetical protein